MKIKMLESVAGRIDGVTQSLAKGAVIELSTESAKDLIQAGYAQQIKAPRKKNDNKTQPKRK